MTARKLALMFVWFVALSVLVSLFWTSKMNHLSVFPAPLAALDEVFVLSSPVPTRNTIFTYDVGALAIFKNEAPYLREWIEYHLLIGVQHFWLVSNDCENEAESNSTLAPYISAGIVTLDRRYVCARNFQRIAYNTVPVELRTYRAVEWYAVVSGCLDSLR
jgi:hypothetical protein